MVFFHPNPSIPFHVFRIDLRSLFIRQLKSVRTTRFRVYKQSWVVSCSRDLHCFMIQTWPVFGIFIYVSIDSFIWVLVRSFYHWEKSFCHFFWHIHSLVLLYFTLGYLLSIIHSDWPLRCDFSVIFIVAYAFLSDFINLGFSFDSFCIGLHWITFDWLIGRCDYIGIFSSKCLIWVSHLHWITITITITIPYYDFIGLITHWITYFPKVDCALHFFVIFVA